MGKCCFCFEPRTASIITGIISIVLWTCLVVVIVIRWINLKENNQLLPFTCFIFSTNLIISCLMVYGCLKQSKSLTLPWLVVTALEVSILLLSALINYNGFAASLLLYFTFSGNFGYLILSVFFLLFYVYLWTYVLVYYMLLSDEEKRYINAYGGAGTLSVT